VNRNQTGLAKWDVIANRDGVTLVRRANPEDIGEAVEGIWRKWVVVVLADGYAVMSPEGPRTWFETCGVHDADGWLDGLYQP
jgi:hypothetical protein